MTPSEAPKALQASECSELLDPTRANCWISAQHQPGKFRSEGWEFDLRPNTGTLQAIRAMAVISSVAATAWYGTLAVLIWSQQISFRFLMEAEYEYKIVRSSPHLKPPTWNANGS